MTTDATAVPQSAAFHIEVDPAAVVTAYAEQRRRFASSAAALDEDALASRSRCSEWSVADVLRHGCDVDRWTRTIWAGDLPFDSFDPRVTPGEEVMQSRSITDAEIRHRYVASAEEMAAEVDHAGPELWGVPTVSFAGLLPWWQALLHLFWDSWIHERDALLPLGLVVEEVDAEVTPVLAHVLALGQYARRRFGGGEPVDAVVCGFRVTAIDGRATVVPAPAPAAAGNAASNAVPVLTGDAPLVVDALSGRGNIEEALSGDDDVVRRLGFFARYLNTPATEISP